MTTPRALARKRADQAFGIVLAMVCGQFLFLAFAPTAQWSLGVLVVATALTLAYALWTAGLASHGRAIVSTLFFVGACSALTQTVVPFTFYQRLLKLLIVAFTIATCAAIARGVFMQTTVNKQSVRGAISVYLLIGLTYTYLYNAIASIDSSPFFSQGVDGNHALHLYFSFVTMTTVGYGDYSPAARLSKIMATTEALVGQLYLVTVLAGLVSQLHTGRPRRDNP